MTEPIIPAPCGPCRTVQRHVVRGEYRKTRPYTDNRKEDWIEEAWFILECRVCRHILFAARWFGSVEQPPGADDNTFYEWTSYVPGETWQQHGAQIEL